MAVISAPAIPEGWHRSELVRIVDPLGLAAAWIAPALAGACIGLSTRQTADRPWRTLLEATADGQRPGCEVVCTRGNDPPVPLRSIVSSARLVERDPTTAVVLVHALGRDLVVSARCDDGALEFGWSWPHHERDDVPFPCLDYRLTSDRRTPVSVSSHKEVHAIGLTIRHGSLSG